MSTEIVSALIGLAGGMVGVLLGFFLSGVREARNRRQEAIDLRRRNLSKLKNLLQTGKALFDQAGGQAFEIKYNPRDPIQKRSLMNLIEHNARISDQLIESELFPSQPEVKAFHENATYLKTQVMEGSTTDWIRAQFPEELESMVDVEIEMLAAPSARSAVNRSR